MGVPKKSLSSHLANLIPRDGKRAGCPDLDGETLKEKVASLEKHLLNDALQRHRWNQSKAAEELGLSRVGLANKIRRYELISRPVPA